MKYLFLLFITFSFQKIVIVKHCTKITLYMYAAGLHLVCFGLLFFQLNGEKIKIRKTDLRLM